MNSYGNIIIERKEKMLKFVNQTTGKLIATEDDAEIPKVGLCTTGWERISTEAWEKFINPTYEFPAWDYPMIKLLKLVRENKENIKYFQGEKWIK